jgi:hypothetical protein
MNHRITFTDSVDNCCIPVHPYHPHPSVVKILCGFAPLREIRAAWARIRPNLNSVIAKLRALCRREGLQVGI